MGADNPKSYLAPLPMFEGEPEIPIDAGFENRPGALDLLDSQGRMAGIGGQEAECASSSSRPGSLKIGVQSFEIGIPLHLGQELADGYDLLF